eukprot:14861316-Alexandrium_andersonii.AAC.1
MRRCGPPTILGCGGDLAHEATPLAQTLMSEPGRVLSIGRQWAERMASACMSPKGVGWPFTSRAGKAAGRYASKPGDLREIDEERSARRAAGESR